MLRDRKSREAFLNATEMLAEAFSKSPACFADVDGGATAARDGIYQATRLTGESILDGLVYAISCRRCSAVYIGETGRTLRERFGEHLRSIEKSLPGFPVAEHFNSNGHALQDVQVRGVMLCDGNKNRKRQEMRLIFKLGTSQPHGLNSDFKYL